MAQIFGTKKWVVAKALRGFRNGLSPVLNDCHARLGAWIRANMDTVLSDPACSIVLHGTSGGIVAFSTLKAHGTLLSSPPTDKLCLLDQIPVQSLLNRVGELHYRPDTTGGAGGKEEVEGRRCLDDLLFAQAWVFNGRLGFDMTKATDVRASRMVLDAGYADIYIREDRWLLLTISERGRIQILLDVAAKLDDGSSSFSAALRTRVALALSVLRPRDKAGYADWLARSAALGTNDLNAFTSDVCRAGEIPLAASASLDSIAPAVASALRTLAEIAGEYGITDARDRVLTAAELSTQPALSLG